MTKATKSDVIRMMNAMHATNARPYYHVRTTDRQILIEMDMCAGCAKVFIDYASACYVLVPVHDMCMYESKGKTFVRILTADGGIKRVAFTVEVE